MDAAVVIITFADFQCPGCNRLATLLERETALHPRDVRIVSRHFPMTTVHPLAHAAAAAAECAGLQGAFHNYAKVLYQHQAELASLSWVHVASLARVPDSNAVAKCTYSKKASDLVQADLAAGLELGVTSTPTFFINGFRRVGAPTPASLDSLIANLLRARHSKE